MKIERINQWFAHWGDWIIKRRWLVLGLFAVFFAVGFYGLQFMNISSSWDSYFLEDDPVLLKTEEFKSIFGNDNFAAVLIECDNIFIKENLELIRRLSNEMMDSISYGDRITSLTDIEFMVGNNEGMTIEQIVPDTIPSDSAGLAEIRRKAYLKPNIANRLVSADGKLTWILLKLRTFPPDSVWRNGKNSLPPETLTGQELHRIVSKSEYASLKPKGTGLPYITERKMAWSKSEMPRVMGFAALFAILVLALVTRSLRGVGVPLLTAAGSIIMAYGALGYLRFTIDSGMMMIPMLLAFAVAVAYNIHVYSYFKRQFLIHGNRRHAVAETISEMGWPVLFSALTTFAALLSFLVVPVKPLHFVGLATSFSVILTFLIAITVMPALLSFGKNGQPHPTVRESSGRWLDRKLVMLGEWVLRRKKNVLWVSAIISVFLIYQFSKIETAFDVEKTMGNRIEYVRNLLSVAKSELGSMYSYDVMIDLHHNGSAKTPETLNQLDSLIHHVQAYPLTKRTTSMLDILKDINQSLHEGNPAHYAIPQSADEVAQLLLLYENAGGSEAEYWIDYDYRRLRLMVEIKSYNSGEAERELADVSAEARRLFPNATVTTVGSLPQFTAMMQYVVRGQIMSFFIALLIIGALMMIVFGSVRTGLIGLVPNIMPAIVVGGLMGWMSYPLDMMTATIMPMILGLAVDDTIHFINHGHLEFSRKKNYREAILRSFRVVGTPLVLTTIIIAANFGVYMTSQATSFIHMGLLSVAGMFAALLADLIITPVLFIRFKIFGIEESETKG